jgi:hypothetical protein
MEEQPWAPPPKDECWEETIPVPVDPMNLITMRRVEWEDQLVEYAIIHSRKDSNGKWVEVTSIDTKFHGSVHRHDGPHATTPYKVLRPILTQEDVQESFKSSYDEVYNSYLESVKGSQS